MPRDFLRYKRVLYDCMRRQRLFLRCCQHIFDCVATDWVAVDNYCVAPKRERLAAVVIVARCITVTPVITVTSVVAVAPVVVIAPVVAVARVVAVITVCA